MEVPRNRKERRAAATAESESPGKTPSIPLVHPSEDPRSRASQPNRTLYDVIAERQGELSSRIDGKRGHTAGGGPSKKSASGTPLKAQFVTVNESGNIVPADDKGMKDKTSKHDGGTTEKDDDDDEPFPPIFDTLLQSITLASLHCTLGILAAQQYAQEIPIKRLLRESTLVAFPLLTLLVHVAHGHVIPFGSHRGKSLEGQQDDSAPLLPLTRDKLTIRFLLGKLSSLPSLQASFFLAAAVFLGDKLITMTNEDGYYAVMKRAPSIGTLWVWSILELPLRAAVIGALAPLCYGAFWKGYAIL